MQKRSTVVLVFLCLTTLGSATELVVPVDESKVVQATGVRRILLTNPRICEAVIVSPHEIVLNGMAPGRTTLLLWDATGRKEVTIVTVAADPDVPGRIRDSVRRFLGADAVDAVFVGSGGAQTLVLRGIVPTEQDAAAVEELARAHFKGAVLNLLEPAEAAPTVEQQLKDLLGPGSVTVYGLPGPPRTLH